MASLGSSRIGSDPFSTLETTLWANGSYPGVVRGSDDRGTGILCKIATQFLSPNNAARVRWCERQVKNRWENVNDCIKTHPVKAVSVVAATVLYAARHKIFSAVRGASSLILAKGSAVFHKVTPYSKPAAFLAVAAAVVFVVRDIALSSDYGDGHENLIDKYSLRGGVALGAAYLFRSQLAKAVRLARGLLVAKCAQLSASRFVIPISGALSRPPVAAAACLAVAHLVFGIWIVRKLAKQDRVVSHLRAQLVAQGNQGNHLVDRNNSIIRALHSGKFEKAPGGELPAPPVVSGALTRECLRAIEEKTQGQINEAIIPLQQNVIVAQKKTIDVAEGLLCAKDRELAFFRQQTGDQSQQLQQLQQQLQQLQYHQLQQQQQYQLQPQQPPFPFPPQQPLLPTTSALPSLVTVAGQQQQGSPPS